MGVFQNNLMGAAAAAASAGGGDFYSHQIANSLRFPSTTGSSLTNSNLSAGNRKTFTFSVWVKKNWLNKTPNDRGWIYAYGTGGATYTFWGFQGHSSNAAHMDDFKFEETSSSTRSAFSIDDGTNESKFRDPGAWMHIVLAIDTTQSTAGNRQKVWINGEAQTLNVTFQMAQDYEFSFINNGDAAYAKMSWLDGLEDTQLAELHFLDGVAADADDFGETKNGVWIPKAYSGSYGNEGYYLKFESSSDLGNDSSGNNNDFTVNNLSAHDQMLDTPTFGSSNGGNYCTLNPLNSGSNNTFSEGNLKVTNTSGGCSALGTMSLITGHKWYFEGKVTGSGNNWIGIIEENNYTNSANTNSSIAGSADFNTYLYGYNGYIYHGSSSTSTGATITTDDIIGVLVDLESATNTIQFYKNGAAQGSAFNLTGTGINYTPMSDRGSSTGNGFWFNFGQEGTFGTGSGGGNSDVNGYGSFYYDDGASAKALCSGNLPLADAINPAETDDSYPQKVFNSVLYTGNGSSQSVTGVGFQPDFTWIKNRNSTQGHKLFDSTRGVTKMLNSGSDDAESTESGLSAFDSDGFSLGGSTVAGYNTSSNTYVAWNWKEGADYGFDVVAYNGTLTGSGVANISHSLGAIPEFIVQGSRSNATGFAVRHQGLTDGNYIMSNQQSMSGSSGTGWGTSAQGSKSGNGDMSVLGTSSTFTSNNTGTLNVNGYTHIAWLWRGIEGFSKFGSYEGNGNANGSFIYTGFRPALVINKRIDGNGSYLMHDNSRNTFNVTNKILNANDSSAEFSTSNDNIDILSNGFKIRSSNAGINGNGNDYVYMAWAHNPFKYATAR
jgi:hypothetical protein